MTKANQYKAMMDQAEPPAHLQDDVIARLDELRGEKAAGSEGAACGSQALAAGSGGKRRTMPRAAKVLVGALAAAVMAGAIVAVPALLPGTLGLLRPRWPTSSAWRSMPMPTRAVRR